MSSLSIPGQPNILVSTDDNEGSVSTQPESVDGSVFDTGLYSPARRGNLSDTSNEPDDEFRPRSKKTDATMAPATASATAPAAAAADSSTTNGETKPQALATTQDGEVNSTPAGEETKADDKAEGTGSNEPDIKQLSEASPEALFQAYMLRMRQQEVAHSKKGPKGSSLVTGMVDYVRLVEDRMSKIEKALEGIKSGIIELEDGEEEEPNKAEEAAKKEGEVDAAEEKKEGEEKEEKPADKWADLLLETKFFCDENEFTAEGDFNTHSLTRKGAFSCNTDPKYLLKVLHVWKDEFAQSPPKLQDLEWPKREQVDIIAFATFSEPIAKFFEKQLGLETDASAYIRLPKPFRPVLRNIAAFRDQLAKLEAKYGSKHPESADSTTKKEEVSSPTETKEDDEPETSTKEGTEEEAYEREDALEHFRSLLKFVDEYMTDQLELLEKMKSGKGEKVSFQDLWMLFDSGDTIYCPFQEGGQVHVNGEESHTTTRRYTPQAYRVVATIGGLPMRKTFAPRKSEDDWDMFDDPWFQFVMDRTRRRRGGYRDNGGMPSERGGDVPSMRTVKDRFTNFIVFAIYIDFDGVKYGVDTELFLFKPFDGEVDIKSLEVYPMQYLDGGPSRPIYGPKAADEDEKDGERDEAVDFLVERGRKFVDVTAVSHMSYDGLTVGKSREQINSAVIIDFKLAFQEYKDSFPDSDSVVPQFRAPSKFWPNHGAGEVFEFSKRTCANLYCNAVACNHDVYFEYQKKQLNKVEPKLKLLLEQFETDRADMEEGLTRFKQRMEERDLIRLLPGVVPAFVLRNRNWVQLDLSQLEYVKQEDEWNKLVLPPGHRRMVRSLVETHSGGWRWGSDETKDKVQMDLVRGKGKGCIILLHGVPGVGKTSTAECVAAYTKRPLYPITCGDIGYVPEAVEANMGKHFKLAHRWGCVLLLDEADVFLAKRSKADVKRNGLVSVFLRILEYYSGILFLTTNRVGAIDDAFRSRLHLTLYYPKLTTKQIIKVWKTNFERLEDANKERVKKGQLPIQFDSKKILRWVKSHHKDVSWNGRQIRNGFQTAIALAEFQAKEANAKDPKAPPKPPVMQTAHFRLIANASMQFSEYLLETHGEDEDETAVRDQVRTKAFVPKTKIREVESESESDSDDSDDSSESDQADDSEEDIESSSEEDSEEEEERKRKSKKKGKKKASEKEKKKK